MRMTNVELCKMALHRDFSRTQWIEIFAKWVDSGELTLDKGWVTFRDEAAVGSIFTTILTTKGNRIEALEAAKNLR